MLCIYARRDNPNIRFGEIIMLHEDEYHHLVYGKVCGRDYGEAFSKSELYFPNHKDGYNQPCFK